MNIFTDLLFIFIYVFALFHLKIIDITNTNVFIQKISVLIAVTFFAVLLYISKNLRNNCGKDVEMWNIIYNAVLVGIFAFMGHTLLFDLWYMPQTNIFFPKDLNQTVLELMVSFAIIVGVFFGKSIRYLFDTNTYFTCS